MKEKIGSRRRTVARFFREKIYLVGVGAFLVLGIALCCLSLLFERKTEADYIQQEVPLTNSGEEYTDMEYHFYLDFSPSMRGFMWKEINSNMAVLADVLMRFDYLEKKQTFYWCDDRITEVGAENFYASMSGTKKFDYYNNSRLAAGMAQSEGEEIQDDLEKKIRDIDLSDIFTHRYEDGMVYSEEKSDLNVIITDFNFMKDNDEGSQQELSERFADNIAASARYSNVSIYQIYSRFAGEAVDSVMIPEEIPGTIENRNLYMIVLSGNDEAYGNFTAYLEQELVSKGVDISNKFELLNSFRGSSPLLTIDKQHLLAMNLIENKNLNLDNKSFENLPSNALGMRLVKGNGPSSLNMYVTPIEIPGYNNPDPTDNSKLKVKVRVYNPIGGKQYQENKEINLIKSANAGFMWIQEQLYLRLLLELDSGTISSESENFIGIWENIGRKRIYVLDIQFFMESPSYSLPPWTEEDSELGIPGICQGIAENKEAVCTELDEASRYLGTMIIYINY